MKISKIFKKFLSIILMLFALFVVLQIVFMFLIFKGVPFTECGPGFGSYQENLRKNYIKNEFNAKLSDEIKILKFECGGFQDRYLVADFQLPQKEANGLMEILESEYNNEGYRDNEYPFNTNMEKKEKREWIEGSDKYIEYKLPSYGIHYVKEVKVKIKNEGDHNPHFYLKAYTW